MSCSSLLHPLGPWRPTSLCIPLYPSSSTFTEDFDMCLTSLPSIVLLPPERACQQPRWLGGRTPILPALWWPCAHHTLLFLAVSNSCHYEHSPTMHHFNTLWPTHSTLCPLCLLHNPTAFLLVSDIWTAKRSWGNHKTRQICANKNSVSTLSTTKQSFYIAGQLSPLPHRDNSMILYHSTPHLLPLPLPVTLLHTWSGSVLRRESL